MARGERRSVLIALVIIALVCGIFSLSGRERASEVVSAAAPSAVAPAAAPDVVPGAAPTTVAGAGDEPAVDDEASVAAGCMLKVRSLRQGEVNDSVTCLQQALIANGYMQGSPTGTFDTATFDAVHKLQVDKDMYVDGIVGRETAIALGIWPDEQLLVVHTPPPAPGAVDLLGFPLSSVASAGADAPPLPANSGSGRRIVYDRAGQRIWAVGKDGEIIRSYLVAGSKYNNELPGVHEVYSKSEQSTAWNGKAKLPLMVRWLKTEKGAIGFHGIPIHVSDGSPYMTEAELGQRLSGGCQRQANADARFMWAFADIGTAVVVL